MNTPTIRTERNPHQSISRRAGEPMSAWDAALDAGALFKVEYHPIALPDGTVPMKGRKPEAIQIVRPDTNVRLGIHSGGYAESGYDTMFETMEELFPESTTSVTVFGQGERVCATQDLGDPIDLGDGDVIQPNIMWLTSHNGTWSTMAKHLMFRWFCLNQLAMGSTFLSVRKTKNHDSLLTMRAHILGEAVYRAKQIEAIAKELKAVRMVDHQFVEIVNMNFPLLGEDDVPAVTRHARFEQREAIFNNWMIECEGPSAFTQWAAYNAFQSFDFHDRPQLTTRAKNPDPLKVHAKRIDGVVRNQFKLSDRVLTNVFGKELVSV